jgi:hypothetical protein
MSVDGVPKQAETTPSALPAQVPSLSEMRHLELALEFTWICHGIAMVAMVLLLLPMMPGGGTILDSERVALLAQHPWRFRLGWFPWQVTAFSDLVLAVALWRVPRVPRIPAALVGLLTIAAVVPDQLAQFRWITEGVVRAQAVANDPTLLNNYLVWEGSIFRLTGCWAATLYSVGACCWSWSFAALGTWNRTLTWLSVVLWPLFLVVSVGSLLPVGMRLPPSVLAAGNAIGFVGLQLWLLLVCEQVMRQTRPRIPVGDYAPWRYPFPGLVGTVMEWLANSWVVREVGRLFPNLMFKSEITDVVYVNYIVEAEHLEPWVPEGLELQRLGPEKQYALFTFLSYRHGHLGPAWLGRIRHWIFSSPVQSNWRIYVRDPRTGTTGIYFTTNALSTRVHALGMRVLNRAMPAHLFAQSSISRSESGEVVMDFDPGQGSAPDVHLRLRSPAEVAWPEPWSLCFENFQAMLAYNVPQDRALSTQPWLNRVTKQEIQLGIPLEICEAMEGKVESKAARAVVGKATPICFYVPQVCFLYVGEEVEPLR